MYNRVILMGRICHDLELKTTQSGTEVLSFRIAVDRNYQPKGEEKKSDFFNIVAWRTNAEFIHKYFGKGRMIIIEGELQNRQYEKNGATQYITEIIVDRASFTGEPKPQNQQAYSPAPQQASQGYVPPATGYQPQPQQPPQQGFDDAFPPVGEDYPF